MLEELKKLDDDQLNAVKYLDNALVIAGAGSGKTTTIIAKISYLIKMGYYQESDLLVISFTNESVNSIKSKLKYNIDVMTFHKLALSIISNEEISICQDNYLDYVIKEYLYSFGKYNKRSNTKIKRIIKTYNKEHFQLLIKTFINLYKANYPDINYLFQLYKRAFFKNKDYLYIILEIYQTYLRELEATCSLDFNDMIIHATNLILRNERQSRYKFIIIDEFQDTSLIRFKLIESIINQNNAKLFVVGDDYQSIYRFSGCDLDIFLNINHYIPNIKRLFLNHNYRNNQTLVDIANKFIIKNKKQIRKNTICHKDSDKPIKIIFYVEKDKVFNRIINTIPDKVLVLGRNNRDKELFKVIEDDRIRFLTIHRAKGLEEDNVVFVNLEDSILGFPSKIKNEELLSKILKRDYLLYEEERRLMYVALTRTKNNIYILVPKNKYSVFIKEIIWDFQKYIEFIHID